jgi:uncharacterized membrane protein YuzA (DUF378 family)
MSHSDLCICLYRWMILRVLLRKKKMCVIDRNWSILFNKKRRIKMKSIIMGICCKVIWIIISLNAINTGLAGFGYEFFSSDFMINNFPQLIFPIAIVVGIAGVLSIIKMFKCCLQSGHCGSEPRSCSRCGSMGSCNCSR